MAKIQIVVVLGLLLAVGYAIEQRSKYRWEMEEIAYTINKFRTLDENLYDFKLFDQELTKFKKRSLAADEEEFPAAVCWDDQDYIMQFPNGMKYDDCQRPGFLMTHWKDALISVR